MSCSPPRNEITTISVGKPGTGSPRSERLHEHESGVDERRQRGQEPDIGRDLERRDREAGDALEREVPQLPVAPLARPGRARVAIVVDRTLPEADPGEQALHDPVAFRQAVERIERAPAEQAEVAGVDRDRHVAQAVHHAVEGVCRRALQPVLARPVAAAHVHDVGAAAPFVEHRRDQFRRILQVRVDDDRRRAMRLAQTRRSSPAPCRSCGSGERCRCARRARAAAAG